MKISQIDIRNFRCFDRLSVSLEQDATAIIGVNGAGKTALMDALAAALSPLLEGTDQRMQGGWSQAVGGRYYKWGISLKDGDVTTVAAGSESAKQSPQPLSCSLVATAIARGNGAQESEQQLTWSHSNISLARSIASGAPAIAGTTSKIDWLTPEGLEPASNGLWVPPPGNGENGTHYSIPAIAYYRDTRVCRRASPESKPTGARSEGHDSAFFRAFDAANSYGAEQQWFYVRENQELREAKSKGDLSFSYPDLDAIRQSLIGMLDGIERIYADEDPPRIKAERVDKNGKIITLEFDQLSAGQRNLMTMTVDFARRMALANPGRDDPLEASGILLIDEIELNLHPKWQQTVIAHLRKAFPNTQIIVATHSPLVLSTLEARQIRILRDQQIFRPSVETYGTDTGRVQRLVMDTQTRPPGNPVTERIDRLYAEIADEHLDKAEKLLAELQAERDSDDPILIEARELIETRKWEKEIGL